MPASQTNYPLVDTDSFTTFDLTAWGGAITATSMTTPTVSSTGGQHCILPAGTSPYWNTHVWMRIGTKGVATTIRNKRIRFLFLAGSPASQFVGPAIAVNSNLTTGYMVRCFINGATLVKLQRVNNIENASPGTTDLITLNITGTTLTSGLQYWFQIDTIGSAGTSIYILSIFAADGVTLIGTATSTSQSNANTDTAAYPIGMSTGQAANVYFFETYDIASPNITNTGAGTYLATIGSTKSLVVSALVGAGGTGPLTYQWQLSIDGGSTWTNTIVGSGGTTYCYTTASLLIGDNLSQFRCIVTDSGNSKTNTTGSYILNTTTAPTYSSLHLNTAGTVLTITWSGTVTYATPNIADWTLTRNETIAAVGIINVSHSTNTTTLTLASAIYNTDSDILLSFLGGAGIIHDATPTDVAAFTNQLVANDSTTAPPPYSASIPVPYNVVEIRAGKGHIQIPVDITRIANAQSLTISVSGLPTGVTATYTHPLTTNLGQIDITGASNAGTIDTAYFPVLTVTNGTTTNTSSFKITPRTNTPLSNTFQYSIIGNSIVNFMDGNTGWSQISTLFGGANPWAINTLAYLAGEFGIVGSKTSDWLPASEAFAARGFLHEAVSWSIKTNARGCLLSPWFANDVILSTINTWADISVNVGIILDYLRSNFDYVLLWPCFGRWDTVAVVTPTVVSSSGVTVTLSSGASIVANQWLFIANGIGTQLQCRKILSVAGAVVTLESAFTFGPVTNGMATSVYADGYTAKMVLLNDGIKNAYCSNVAGASAPKTGVFWYDATWFTAAKDIMRSDRIHPPAEPAQNITLGNLVRDNVLVPHLLSGSSVSVSPTTVLTSSVTTMTYTVSNFSAFNGTAWPGNLIGATWTSPGGGSVTSGGVYTAPGTPATSAVQASMTRLLTLFGTSDVVAPTPPPSTGGKENSIFIGTWIGI